MSLSSLFNTIQTRLFPWLEEQMGELSVKEKQFIRTAEICNIGGFTAEYDNRFGRPISSRCSIALAFIAKAVYAYPTTKALIEVLKRNTTLRILCGWESITLIPSESTFSRAFAEFSKTDLPQRIHESMIERHYGDKIAGHLSRDSTPISAREKATKKPKSQQKSKKNKAKRGRPKKGEERKKEPTKVQIQSGRSLDENIADIPCLCDTGAKRDSKGYKKTWIGYKLHVDCVDGDIPVAAILSSASTHDSQVSIPLTQMSSRRITYLYELMDSAYDSKEIHEFSINSNHVPVIDSNKRRGVKIEFDPAKKLRYNQRSSAERIMSNLKDNFGGNTVRVKGASKVMAHLMFGIIAMTAQQLCQLVM